MVPHTLTYKPLLIPSAFGHALVRQLHTQINKIIPRPCILRSAGLLLVGWGLPTLMLLELIPSTLYFGFIGFALAATGSVLLLFYLGKM